MGNSKTIDFSEVMIKSFLERKRPPAEIRDQFDIGYSFDGKTAIFFEIKSQFNNPKEKIEIPFAKIRHIKSSKIWKLYWMRGTGKWVLYDDFSESSNLEKLLLAIEEDRFHCFFG